MALPRTASRSGRCIVRFPCVYLHPVYIFSVLGSPLWAAVPRLLGGGKTPLLPAGPCLPGGGINLMGGGTTPAGRRDRPCGRRCHACKAAGPRLLGQEAANVPAVPRLLGGGIIPRMVYYNIKKDKVWVHEPGPAALTGQGARS